MAEDNNTTILAIAAFSVVAVVGLIGLFMFMSRSRPSTAQTAPAGVMVVEPTEKGGWIIIRASSLESAGFKQEEKK